MDSVTLIMFAFSFLIGFIFLILGFTELREIFKGKEKGMAAPAMGTIYFLVSMLLWFVLAAYWPAMATDQALAALGFLWYGIGGISLVAIFVCVGTMLRYSFNKPEQSKLEIREERKNEGY